ncbi:predicted protein [Phaeodactylum tricornutum CCAP 1055/1]|uniref:Integrase catalytic domain-containing protein n=1 Tax=Phaeodactylum tricornutum (strain CCAP 1055/1) TaxID=556484 RepID=B7S4F5_PHATC|nr:predicted protein [Phaeodactylum tricornutum CCAP 1055/1]EEC42564.1 predicted protein [Phaeodactylum tricornutum CCAP 1055/1]|eukprot:XP_002176441.1 predicted protein [Phaeodactylum tricornutum CCAP 1055/1]
MMEERYLFLVSRQTTAAYRAEFGKPTLSPSQGNVELGTSVPRPITLPTLFVLHKVSEVSKETFIGLCSASLEAATTILLTTGIENPLVLQGLSLLARSDITHSSNTATKVVEGSEPVLATSTGVGSKKEVRLVTAKDLKYSGRPNPGTLPTRLPSPTQDLTRLSSPTQDLVGYPFQYGYRYTDNVRCKRFRSFTRHDDLDRLLSIFEGQIETLEYLPVPSEGDATPVPIKLRMGHQQLLRYLLLWIRQLSHDKGGSLSNYELISLMKEDFSLFRRSPSIHLSNAVPTPSSQSSTPSTMVGNSSRSAVADFKRGVKRDKTHYPVLKDDRYWDNFYRTFVVTAVSHNVDNVLDPAYSPTNTDEILLFREQKKFVYSALEHCLQTDMGKNIVREHAFDFDAQTVFAKVVKHYTESTPAKISSGTTLSYLTSAKYGSSWTGTAEGFILHWKNHLRIYNDTVPVTEKLPPQLCLSLLESSVRDVSELRQVNTTANLDLAKGGSPINYENYLSLLLAAATLYDKGNNFSNSRSPKSKRSAFVTETTFPDDEYGVNYDIDLSPSILYEANTHNRRAGDQNRDRQSNVNRERPYIPREMWDKLSDDAKEILRGMSSPKEGNASANSKSSSAFHANSHSLTDTGHPSSTDESLHENDNDKFHDCGNDTELLAHLTDRSSNMANGDIRKVLASASSYKQNSKNSLQSNMLEYSISRHSVAETTSSLIDRGANGGLAGSDVKILNKTGRSASITGINDHPLPDLDIVTAAGLVESQHGPIIVILHQYAHHGKGKTIHSSAQLEYYKNIVEDRSRVLGGKQRIITLDDYVIPLHVRQGLAYMDMRPPSDAEFDTLPHVVLTSDVDWDPSIIDNEIDLVTDWHDATQDLPSDPYVEPRFNSTGEHQHRHVATFDIFSSSDFVHWSTAIDNILSSNQHDMTRNSHNYEALRPCLGWVSANTVQKTIMATTQFACEVYNAPMRKHFKSRFPALNVHRRNEAVATDTIWSDTPAVDNGAKFAQLFVGRRSLVTDIYPMKTDKEFVNALEDNIRHRGAMDKLISDRAKAEISKKVSDITRAYHIDQWQSKPNHQHQNYAERRIATVEANANNFLNKTGAPNSTWLLCVSYICYLFNHLAHESLHDRTPLEILNGSTPDISVLLQFHFWEPIFYRLEDPTFPSDGTEKKGPLCWNC